MIVLLLALGGGASAEAAPAGKPQTVADVLTNGVEGYRVEGEPVLTSVGKGAALEHYSGPRAGMNEILEAATELQSRFRSAGYTNVTVAIGLRQITNGIVTLTVFRGAFPQILLDGKRYPSVETIPGNATVAAASTNRPTAAVAKPPPPGFKVRAYEIQGDTLLSTKTLTDILEKYTGTNITVADVLQAGADLQSEYRQRGYPTVNVTIPPQKIDSNGIVKIRVFQGRLAEINVLNNRYFSSNNVMRQLPSLHTNIILEEPVFQAELDRANANQDRQIYPQISPGPVEGTTTLDLKVKDRLPLHAKLEFNNQNSPGTPDLRLNASAVYNNLWQHEHSFGLQYGFSPEVMKAGDEWRFYDRPLVANYSGFYRLPLGNPSSLVNVVTSEPGSFGYDEATHKFRLPPPTGRPELNFYASRSTVDTGLETLRDQLIYNVPGVRQVGRRDVQEDTTINEDVGFRLSVPLRGTQNWRSTFSGGLDFKTYSLTSNKTNNFTFTEITINPNGSFNPPIVSTVSSPVPTTESPLNYVPVTLRYDGSVLDPSGTTYFGLGVTVNPWYSGSLRSLHQVTGSTLSSGHWVTVNPSISRDFTVYTNWVLGLHAEGQWASEPLVSTEEFGAGGVNNVRGYYEGELFGDSGWRLSIEQRTPAHLIGLVSPRTPMTIRGAVYMDYAEVYPLNPLAQQSRVPLWGTGVGAVLSIGTHWEARFLFSWPLLSAGLTTAYEPRFNFSLSGQF